MKQQINKLIYILGTILSINGFASLNIDNFYKSEDGDDYNPAFTRALTSAECINGCRIELGCKTYIFKDTLRLCKPVILYGCGERTTNLIFPSGKTGIVLGYGSKESTDGQCFGIEGTGAQGSVLSEFQVSSGADMPPELSKPNGYAMIDIKTGTITLKNIKTTGGTHGIRISAGLSRIGSEKSTANHWRMDMVNATYTHHAPIFIRGPDSNTGVGISVSGVNGCKFSSKIKGYVNTVGSLWDKSMVDCAGVMDASFLGNTWIGSHVAMIYDTESKVYEKAYLSKGDNQLTTFIGSYAENSSECGEVSARSISMGGISCFGGFGLTFNSNKVSNINLISPTISTRTIGLTALDGFQRLMVWRFPGAESVDYISWDYDQRHRSDGVTPVYAPGHDTLSVRLNGSNTLMPLKWSMR